jgi:AcrR family transcriptional regulator
MALDVDVCVEAAVHERNLGSRHLGPSRDDALGGAALTLLAEIGYDPLTVDKIAASAEAGKSTIYRRWLGEAKLVVDALIPLKEEFVVAETENLRGDLTALALQVSADKKHPLDSQVMIGLVSALSHDPELRDVFYERLVNPHLAALKMIFERAVARGEIAPVKNLDTVVSMVPALVLHHVIVMGTVPDEQFFVFIIDQVILPLVQAAAIAPDHLT